MTVSRRQTGRMRRSRRQKRRMTTNRKQEGRMRRRVVRLLYSSLCQD